MQDNNTDNTQYIVYLWLCLIQFNSKNFICPLGPIERRIEQAVEHWQKKTVAADKTAATSKQYGCNTES